MVNKSYDDKLNEIIRESMELEDMPSLELNNQLKSNLYKREAVIKQAEHTHALSIWFVPMILNFIIFLLFAILALLVISNPYLAKLAACICGYISIAGFFVTVVGVKRTNMKKVLTIRVLKRGALA